MSVVSGNSSKTFVAVSMVLCGSCILRKSNLAGCVTNHAVQTGMQVSLYQVRVIIEGYLLDTAEGKPIMGGNNCSSVHLSTQSLRLLSE